MRERLTEAIYHLALTTRGDIRHVVTTNEYRLRVGDWRIRFADENGQLLILALRHRRDAYQ